jgi:hypothetical protein
MSALSGVLKAMRCRVVMTGLVITLSGLLMSQLSYAAATEGDSASGSSRESVVSKLPEVQRLGDDTSAYVFRAGWEELKPRLAGTQALAAIEDPQVQAFFKAVKAVGEAPHPSSPFFHFIYSALHDQLVMATRPIPGAQSEPSEEEQEQGKPKKPSTQNFAIITPGPQGKAQFGRLYADAIKALKQAADAEVTKSKIGPLTFDVLDEADTGIHAAWNDERCYWAVGAGSARWAAESSPPVRPLDRSELFQNAVNPLLKGQQQQPIALYYYDLRPWWRKVDSLDAQGMWKKVSWRSLDAVSGATFIEKDHYRNRHYWRVGSERYGLFQHSNKARINEAWLKRVPADCSGFTTGVWDAYSFMAFLPVIVMNLFGAEDSTIVQAPMFVAPFQPILQQLGPRYLIYRVPGRYGSFPLADVVPLSNAVAIAEVRDPKEFAQALAAFSLGTGVMPVGPNTSTVLGRTVVGVNVMYFTIYFAMLDKEVLITMNPQLLKDAIEAVDRPGPSVIETAAYKEAARSVPPDACFMLYMPPGGFCRGIYDHYIPMLQQTISLVRGIQGYKPGAKTASGLDPLVFPRGSDIARHAKQATIISAVDDGQGVLFDGTAPILTTPYYWAYVHAFSRLLPAEKDYPPLIMAVVPFIGLPGE